jgi:outer membrane protein OmpA-like peptidoglycan-associated protein
MIRLLFIYSLLNLPFIINAQQHYTGYSTDNNSGFTKVYNQPAELVDDRTKFNISSSFAMLRTNNFKATNFNYIFNPLQNQLFKYRKPSFLGYESNNFSIDIFGIKYEINHKNAIGYSVRYRSFKNLDGLSDGLSKFSFNNFNDPDFVSPYSIDFNHLNFNKFNYFEHSFNYARVIIDEKERFVKVGGALKLINGTSASFYEMNGATVFTSQDTTQFNNTDIKYGYADNNNSIDGRHNGVGLDVGVVYEFRPDYKSYRYDMDGKTNIERYDVKKYKYKVGLSITNIGSVKFNKNGKNQNFNSSSNVNFGSLFTTLISPVYYIENTLKPMGTISSNQNNNFRMNLPTSFNAQFDYRIINNFYINYSTTLPLKFKEDKAKVHQKMMNTITPRIEKNKWSIMLPISIQRNGQLNVGSVGRIVINDFTIFAGSNNLTFLFGKRALYTASFYGGMAYSIFYDVPSDIDGDKISDPFDDCKFDPGLIELKGCPDTDGDGIPDKDDYCIFDKGPKNTFGCPDRDNDGVIDLNDQCPDEAGLAIHYGCPDKDRDGVIDVADKCPDVPGVELNNGCPFEITNCCLDDDGDAVPNSSDKCPTIPGSVYNAGCPIDSSNINTINLNEAKNYLDPNHTNTKIDDIKDTKLTDSSMILNQNEISDDYPGKSQLTSINIYFNTDDATIYEHYHEDLQRVIDKNKGQKVKYVIIGHTDNRGSDNYNLILSKKRAEIVKRTLIDKGVDPSQIVVYYYGEWKPVKSNDNVVDRKFNRRVEVKVFKE